MPGSLVELFYNISERICLFELQVKLSDFDLVNFTAICETGDY